MASPEKKLVLKVDLHDDRGKQKAMKAVTTLIGIDSITMDMKEMKMTVIGVADPVAVVSKLRKSWRTDIVSIGPAKEAKKEEPKKEEAKKEEEPKKEEAKKEEPKKEEAKKEEPKNEETKKEEPKKEEEPKNEEPKKEAEIKKRPDPAEQVAELVNLYRAYNPRMTVRYAVHSAEEDPNSCVIL